MRLETAREKVIVVRPTKLGQWETVNTIRGLQSFWQSKWDKWWEEEGIKLQKEHPDWWKKE